MQKKLPRRKDMRLRCYDYSSEGYYFITICMKNRLEILGKINNEDKIELTKEGKTVQKYIKQIEQIYEIIKVDEYVIMPNHIHMIIVIKEKSNLTISRLIQQYKGMVTKELGKSIWQKLFHEYIIRGEKDYYVIKNYVRENVAKWKKDIYY